MNRASSLISKHLLVAVTLFFVTGILSAPWLPPTPSFQSPVAFGTLTFLILAILFYFADRTSICLLLLAPLFMSLGFSHCSQRLQLPGQEHHIYNQITAKQEVVLLATMTSMASFNGKISKAVVAVKSIRHEKSPGFNHSTGKIQLGIEGIWPENLLPGDTIAVRAELKRPLSYRTPGAFDYVRFLAQKGIWITGFIRSPLFIHRVTDDHSLLRRLRYLPERVRNTIGKQIDSSVHSEAAGVYRAILIGDRGQVSSIASETFKRSGVFHILAISGLHMTVIGTILYACIYWLLSRSEMLLLRHNVRKIAAFSCLPFLIFYSLLAGMNTPVIRSVIMSTIVILALCTDRQKSPGPLIAAAVLLILCFDPLQIFTVSFQLSFIAISSIIFLLPTLQSFFIQSDHEDNNRLMYTNRLIRWVMAGLSVSIVAAIATGPVSMHNFNRISLVGPVANLFIEPLFCTWSLPLGFIAIPVMLIYPDLSSVLLQIGAQGLELGLYAAQQFSSLPFASIRTATPPPWLVCTWYALILLIAVSYRRRYGFRTALTATMLLCSVLLFSLAPEYFFINNKKVLKAFFLDVGQGTATVLEYPSGQKILIDSGSSSSSSVGERIIAPFLWSKGIHQIDAIAITHPDADHYNGLPFILKQFTPGTLWLRDKHGHDDQYRQLIDFAEETQTLSVEVPTDGLQLFSEGMADLTCIANIGNWQNHNSGKRKRATENSGLVLKACADTICLLFPGDIEKTYERKLVDKSYRLNSDILLSPHHGSATSNSESFLDAVSPIDIIVSAGRSGRMLFPSQELQRFSRIKKMALHTTSNHGTLEVIVENNEYGIHGYQRKDNNPLLPFERVVLRSFQ